MDIVAYNRNAWNQQSRAGNRWCIPVSSEAIQAAQRGEWSVLLTPNKSVPRKWFGDVRGKQLLCLASGGGQQAPILAAAGAIVTSFDNSDDQLAKDRFVAERDAIALTTIQGDMADLSTFADEQFDLIFHPVANVFIENVRPVWQECFRVLKPGGRLLAGFMNPLFFLFDHEDIKTSGQLQVRYSLPYSDLTSLPAAKKSKIIQTGAAFEFGHTLEDQIGGQIHAGFVIAGLYEDDWNDDWSPLNRFAPLFLATLAVKLRGLSANSENF